MAAPLFLLSAIALHFSTAWLPQQRKRGDACVARPNNWPFVNNQATICRTQQRCLQFNFFFFFFPLLSFSSLRVLFDLPTSSSPFFFCSTLPFECRRDIERIAISPNGALLLVIDGQSAFLAHQRSLTRRLERADQGKSVLVNLLRRVVLSHFDFKSRVLAIRFSPNGRFFAVSHHRNVRVWRTPSTFKGTCVA